MARDDENYGETSGLLNGEVEQPHEAASLGVWLAVIATSCATFTFGYTLAFSSPTFCPNPPSANNVTFGPPQGNDKFLDIQMAMSSGDTTWFASIVNIGAGVGAVIAGKPVDHFGKRLGMVAANLLYVLGYVLIYTTPRVFSHASEHSWDYIETHEGNSRQMAQLMISRVILGFAIGVTCCTVGNYQTEVATLKLRGAFGTCFQIAVCLGLVVVTGAGLSLHWEDLCLLAIIVNSVGAVLCFFLPETPQWLLAKGRADEAELSLTKMRSPDSDLDGLMVNLRAQCKTDDKSVGLQDLLVAPRGRALMIGVAMMVVQQMTGVNVVMFYTSKILSEVWSNQDTINKLVVALQALQLLLTIVLSPLVDRFGRKPLLIFAGTGICVFIGVMNIHFFDSSTSKAFTVIGFYGYVAAFSMGMGAIPWFIMGELFHPDVKGVASSIATLTNWSVSFFVTKTVTSFQTSFGGGAEGMGWVFTMYGCTCFVGILFIIAFVPETKGIPYKELEQKLLGKQGYSEIQN